MLRPIAVRLGFAAVIAAALRAQSPSPLFRVLEEHVPYDFRPLAALDVDLDGDQDLLCREGVLLNDGTGRFAPSPVAPTLVSYLFYSIGIACADLDGDGNKDLLIRAPTFGPGATGVQMIAFAATPAGLAQASVAFPVAVGLVAPFDYDLDGDDDLLVGGAPSLLPPEGAQIWENQNGTSFVPQLSLIPATGDGPSSAYVAAGDFDGDGDVDAFSVDLVVGTAKFFLRSGPSFVATTTPLPTGSTALTGAAVGDFDGDGNDDVVLHLANAAALPHLAVDVGLRIVGGSPVATVEASLHIAAGFAALDYDGDGALDRALSPIPTGATTARPSLEIRSGLPTNSAAPTTPLYSEIDGPVAKFSFDADGDGDLDLMCVRANRTPRVFFAEAAGGLYEARGDACFAVAGSGEAGVLTDVVVGDFDGDGDTDLARFVVAGCLDAPLAVLRNDGHGRFPPSSVPAGCISGFPSLGLAADFDGDGRDDVFRISQPGSANAVLHRSLAGGGFGSAAVATESGTVTDLVVGDLDNDGDVDAAACFAGIDLLVRYFNDGNGNFVRSALPSPPGPTGLRVADMNADGVVDYVLAAAAGVTMVNGSTPTSTVAVFGASLERVEAGDLDGDGDADLLVDGQPYLQAGGGAFVAQAPLPLFPLPNAGPTLPQQLLDVDGDGDLDALAYGSLWRNASGAFSGPEPVPFPTVGINQIAQTGFMPFYRAADFDRDGDPDLLDPTGRLIANVARHLSRGAPAAIGRVGTLDVCGPPQQPFALFASASAYQQNPFVVPGWGNLFLVPGAAVFAGEGVFDANAGAAVPFAVPNVPALVGLDLYWQAVLPLDGKITNVERTRILSL
jgi:DNA gyrase/topoisomerase IV subunit B